MPTFPTLLRRHRPACDAHRPADSYSTEAEERRRAWKKCDCKIYAHGTLGGRFRKLATGARDWDHARAVLAPYLAAGRWDIDPPPLPPQVPRDADRDVPRDSGLPIAAAVARSLKDQQAVGNAHGTRKKYRTVLRQFSAFSARTGLRYLEQWSSPLVREFRASWAAAGNQPLTIKTKLGYLKAFFEPFVEDEVLPRNPARIRTPRNVALKKGDAEQPRGQKNPFTDEQIRRMLEEARRTGRTQLRRWPKKNPNVVPISEYRDFRRKWSGEDIADFMEVLIYTGLRISDVALFDIARLTDGDEVRLRATKNGNWVTVAVPPFLAAMIRRRALRCGPKIFGAHRNPENIDGITDLWRDRLKQVWARMGPWTEPPTPHRFRHTFVRILLERGVPVARVAELIGDTEDTVRRHYSAWVTERQESLNRLVREAFGSQPRFRH